LPSPCQGTGLCINELLWLQPNNPNILNLELTFQTVDSEIFHWIIPVEFTNPGMNLGASIWLDVGYAPSVGRDVAAVRLMDTHILIVSGM